MSGPLQDPVSPLTIDPVGASSMSLTITFDPKSPKPLQHQLCEAIRQLILSGRLLPGQRLPSTRELATSLSISRNTVIASYEQLKSEGYLQTVVGSGAFVGLQLPEALLQPEQAKELVNPATLMTPRQPLSDYGASLADTEPFAPPVPEAPINFRYARPAFDQVPLQQWNKLWARHCRLADADVLDYAPDSLGYPPLRTAIARYVARSRSVQCEADQVIIVNGSVQTANLIARILLERGDWAAVENPGFVDICRILQAQGAQVLPIPVDQAGLMVDHLFDHPIADRVKLLHVTPSHQSPLGVVLSLPRRLELLAWATETGAIILEEDFDSEYRYSGRPIPALQGLDRSGSVLYTKDFSESLFPALRLGYLVAPKPLVHVLSRAKWLADRHAPLLEQRVLTDFINQGYLERHIRRMRSLYHRRRQTLVQALTDTLGPSVTMLGDEAGTHLTVRFHSCLSDDDIIQRAAQVGIGLGSTGPYYIGDGHPGEFLLGYAALHESQIRQGINSLARILKSQP